MSSLTSRRRLICAILALMGWLSYATIDVLASEYTGVTEHVLSALKQYDLCSIDAAVRTIKSSSDHPVDKSDKRRSVGIQRGASRVRYYHENFFLGDRGSLGTVLSENILLSTGEVLSCQQLSASELSPSEPELYLMLWSEQLAGMQRVNRGNLSGYLGESSVLLWFVGRTPLGAYISDVDVIRVRLIGDGKYRIDATSDYGKAVMTVSEASGWLPTDLEIRKTADSLTSEGPLSSFYDHESDEEVPVIRACTWRVQASDFRQANNGIIAPYELTIATKEEYADQGPIMFTRAIQLERLHFGEPEDESDFELGIAIPVGQPVTVVGAEHLSFEWDGARPVPSLPKTVAKVTPIQPKSSPWSARSLMLAINVVLVMGLAAIWWWRRNYANA